MFSLLYFLGASLVFPFALFWSLFSPRVRERLSERLASGAWRELGSPSKIRIWFHGASVGEITGLAPVISRVLEDERFEVVITTTSLTGNAEARKRFPLVPSFLLPFDHPLLVSRVLNRIQPALVAFTETEIWPGLLFALERRSVPALLVNGRISDYSFPSYRRVRLLMKPLWGAIERFLVQTELDAERFATLGVSREEILVCGSTKYDHVGESFSVEENERFAKTLGISNGAPCFVAGSVRPGEDEQVIEGYLLAREQLPELQMVLAPRHPERFEAVARLLEKFELPYHRRSSGDGKGSAVVLLDTLGELKRVYPLATVSFVGGTLVDIGGHNPLEPAPYSCPVLLGPFTRNVRDAVSSLSRVGALLEVSSPQDLASEIVVLCEDDQRRESLGELTKKVWQSNLGVTEIVLEEIVRILDSRSEFELHSQKTRRFSARD